MIQKVLIANRGEIALRIIRTCRELGLASVAVYEPADIGSLHVRLADECVVLDHPDGFFAQEALLQIAAQVGADALHPGYGFLAERPDFIERCTHQGLRWIGPALETVALAYDRVRALETARQGGYATADFVELAEVTHTSEGEPALAAAAEGLGYPVVVKPGCGWAGRGERVVVSPTELAAAARYALAVGRAAQCDRGIYLEKAIQPARRIAVAVLRDRHGRWVHLGDSQVLVAPGNRKLIEETPAPGISAAQRAYVHRTAGELAALFGLTNAAVVEFLVDGRGQFHFVEFKARLSVEHALAEMRARLDIVRQQIRLADGEPLELTQEQVRLEGAAMACRIQVEDPRREFLPSPGRLRQARLPGGGEVRVDTYVYTGCDAPGRYDPLVAKLTVWGEERRICRARLLRALDEVKFSGLHTNLGLLKAVVNDPDFAAGSYALLMGEAAIVGANDRTPRRDLAIICGLLYEQRNQRPIPVQLERNGLRWKRDEQKATPDLPFLRIKAR